MQPRITLETPLGDTFPLWVVQDTERDVINEVDRTQIPYRQPEDNILFSQGQEQEDSLSGIVTADLFTRHSDGYSDGLVGAAEWTQDLFSLVGAQGDSLTVTDHLEGTSFRAYLNRFNIQLGYPRDGQINWDLQFVVGRGLTQYQGAERRAVGPTTNVELGGRTLPHPVTFSMSKSADTETTVIPDPDGTGGPEENLVQESGTSRSFTLGFRDLRDDTLAELRDLRRFGETYTFTPPFPGGSYDVMVDQVGQSRDTETPVEYELEMIQ